MADEPQAESRSELEQTLEGVSDLIHKKWMAKQRDAAYHLLAVIRELDPKAKVVRSRSTGQRSVRTTLRAHAWMKDEVLPIEGTGESFAEAVQDWWNNMTRWDVYPGSVLAGSRDYVYSELERRWRRVGWEEMQRGRLERWQSEENGRAEAAAISSGELKDEREHRFQWRTHRSAVAEHNATPAKLTAFRDSLVKAGEAVPAWVTTALAGMPGTPEAAKGRPGPSPFGKGFLLGGLLGIVTETAKAFRQHDADRRASRS